MDLTIKQYAEAGGVGVETVRFYQRKGLLDTPDRAGGIRRYGEADVRRLRFIRMAQRAGFTLEEIRELLALDSGQDRQRARDLARARIARLDAQIAEMERARLPAHARPAMRRDENRALPDPGVVRRIGRAFASGVGETGCGSAAPQSPR